MKPFNRRDFLKLSASGVISLNSGTARAGTQDQAKQRATPIHLSDLSRCLPASALSKTSKKGHWTLISYEAGAVNGVMIGAGSMAEAPDVTLPLGVTGWHAVYLGFWNPHHDYDGDTTLKVKLTGDVCFQPISDGTYGGAPAAPVNWTATELSECFLRYADLTARDLVIGQQTKGAAKKAYVAYVKLVPLSQEEVDSVVRDRARKDTRVLIASNDGISFLDSKGCTTKEEILEQVEPYRYSDVAKVLWAFTYGDITNYPTRVGRILTARETGTDITTCRGNKITSESLETLISNGLVPAQVALEHVHSMGLEFHAMFRMGILGDIPPSSLLPAGLVRHKPEVRILAKDGTPIEKASYAFPEVQEHMLSLIREVAEGYDIDGANLGWIRGPQFVGYEAPVIEDFQKRYGEDPRKLDDNDRRVQQHRASYVSGFVRRVRTLLNEVGSGRGRRLELSACVYSPESNLFYGLDVEAWLAEGLLDTIIGSGPKDFIRAVKARGCRFYQSWKNAEAVLEGYEKGVDGFFAWDLNLGIFGYSQELPHRWALVSRLGHMDEVAAFAKEPPSLTRMRLKTVGGFDIWHTTNAGANERKFWPPEMLPLYSGG